MKTTTTKNMNSPKISISLFAALLFSIQCNAQLASISVNNVNTNVMTNTKLLFGITFDSRTSLMGNSTLGLIGYYDSSGVAIPQVSALFNNFPMTTLR